MSENQATPARLERDTAALSWLAALLGADSATEAARLLNQDGPRDAWLGWAARQAARPATRSDRPCSCGCGETTKSRFAPGHDARLVSQLAKRDGSLTAEEAAAAVRLAGGSAALQLKASQARTAFLAAGSARRARAAAKTAESAKPAAKPESAKPAEPKPAPVKRGARRAARKVG